MFIVIAILMFGLLIAIHELGHFLAAKKMGVKVVEFSIGMGPKIFARQRGETLYAWRLLPIGGACVMEGEDEGVDDPRAFTAQKRWKRAVILLAGSAFNFAAGYIIILFLCAGIGTGDVERNVVESVTPGSAYENVLQPGDKITSVNGKRISYGDDFLMFINQPFQRGNTMDLTVRRGGETVRLDDIPLESRALPDRDGVLRYRLGINFVQPDMNIIERLKYSGYSAYNYVRMVGLSLGLLFDGGADVRDLSGPVGIVTIINDVGNATTTNEEGETVPHPLSVRLTTVFDITALIAINLAVMNLLPIPALDGGRIFGLIVTFFIEKITRRRLDPKYEGYVHAAGFVLLLGLMLFVMVSDVLKVFDR